MTGYLRPLIQDKYLKRLEDTPFSLALDEGTVNGTSYLGIRARYFEKDEDLITKTKLIGLLKMGKSSTGEALKELIDHFMFKDDASGQKRRSNLVGISTDHASNMLSAGICGLQNRFAQESNYLEITNDYCHAVTWC